MLEDKLTTHTLEKDDVVYYLHIPKTAGVTLTRLLDDYFDYDKILQPELWKDLLNDFPENMKKYQFVRGHFGYGVHGILAKKLFYLTILREPIERTLSNIDHHLRSHYPEIKDTASKNAFIEKFTTKMLINRGYKNMQTHYVGVDFDSKKLVENMKNRNGKVFVTSPVYMGEHIEDEDLLKQAKKNLEDFAFVGITERFEESMQLLCYTFGWKPFRNIKKFNVGTNRIKQEALQKKISGILNDFNKLDIELYNFAYKIFENRYQKMVKILKEKYYEEKFADLSENNLVIELLEKHYQAMFQKNKLNGNNFTKSCKDDCYQKAKRYYRKISRSVKLKISK